MIITSIDAVKSHDEAIEHIQRMLSRIEMDSKGDCGIIAIGRTRRLQENMTGFLYKNIISYEEYQEFVEQLKLDVSDYIKNCICKPR